MDVKALVTELADRAQTRDGDDAIDDAIKEVVDSYINTAQTTEHQEILDTLGECDLSEPKPDLTEGWSRVRGQLAYNALYQAVVDELKSRS